MTVSIREIVDDAQELVGEVAGAGVQTYGEDRMRKDVIRAFNMLFTKTFWPQYSQWFRVELDGTTGIITTDSFEQVRSIEDVRSVRRDGASSSIPILSAGVNPYTLSGTSVLYWTSLASTHADYKKRKLLFYPATSTGFLNIHARIYPLVPPATNFEFEATFELDRDLLVYGTAFMTLMGDDLNPTAADICRTLMEMRRKDILDSMASHPIHIRGGTSIPNEWTTV